MPSLMRKFFIFAVADGLVLQSHGGAQVEQSQALRIDWKTAKLTPWKSTPIDELQKKPHVESHGIVGLLSVASYSFLISITRREQVAQIYGKPIYVIKDVSILPLSSRVEAEHALEQANAVVQKDKDSGDDSDQSDAESVADNESVNYESLDEGEDADKRPQSRQQSSVVEDVIERKGKYGRFAAQWFSRSGWSQERKRAMGLSQEEKEQTAEEPAPHLNVAIPATQSGTDSAAASDAAQEQAEDPKAPTTSFALLPRLLRTTRALLSSKSFYFSYDINITRRIGTNNNLLSKPPSKDTIDELFFWNHHLTVPFLDTGYSSFFMPVMQGFVGQRAFLAQRADSEAGQTEAVGSLERILEADQKLKDAGESPSAEKIPQPFLLTVISRRSVKRSGLRYLRRGIDDEGNTANCVETEQILSSPTWDDETPIRSFLQLRGSIPLYFSQSPYSFKPVPVIHQSQEANQAAFQRHFENIGRSYGAIQIAMLVDKHGTEAVVGQEYEAYTKRYNESQPNKIAWEWFDFHSECRGMKFENVNKLVTTLKDYLEEHGETVIKDKAVSQRQTGIVRSNCMDCLDRTNVVESALGQYMLEKDLRAEGFDIDFKTDPSTQWFNTLWADNGDAISRQYAGTAALKGDFTRTRKRNYRGAVYDFSLTLSRYYNNIVNDYFAQTVIDYVLGNATAQVFEEFEADMMNSDPGVSMEKIRQKAIETCEKLVLHDEEEDLIHGWTMLSPNAPNTLRSLPMQESILLLTDRAIYNCRFDWNTEKVDSFERIDLNSVTNIRYGPYITAALTERQLDESRNMGIAITYSPDKGSVIRVNTRSMQNEVDPETKDSETPTDHLEEKAPAAAPKTGRTKTDVDKTRFMALKVIPGRTVSGESGDNLKSQVENVAEDIQRAVKNANSVSEEEEHNEEEEEVKVEQIPIISATEAKKNTGNLEWIGHQVKKFVWG